MKFTISEKNREIETTYNEKDLSIKTIGRDLVSILYWKIKNYNPYK